MSNLLCSPIYMLKWLWSNIFFLKIHHSVSVYFLASTWGVCVLQLCAAGRSQTLPVWCCLLIGPRPTTRGKTASGVSMWKRTRGSCLTSKCKRVHPGVRLEITQTGQGRRSGWPRDVKHSISWHKCTHSQFLSHLFSQSHRHATARTWGRLSVVAVAN